MNNSITFIENDRLWKRLNTYYTKKGFNEFPISKKLTPEEVLLRKKSLDLIDGEFLINQFKMKGHEDIIVSSRKLGYFSNGKLVEVFPFEEINSIFLSKNFKIAIPKILNVNLKGGMRSLEFEDNIELSAARNEIFHIINNAIVNWQGKDFLVSESD